MAADAPKEPVFQNRIQAGQILQMLPMLAVLGALIKLIFIAGATYTAFTTGLADEQKARIADVAQIQRDALAAEDRLSRKIDYNHTLQGQEIKALSMQMGDIKATVSEVKSAVQDIANASRVTTPAKR